MKRGAVVLLVLAVLAAAPTRTEAAIRQGSVEIGVHGGYDQIDADTKLNDTIGYGANIAVSVLPSLQVGLVYGTANTDSKREGLPNADYTDTFSGLQVFGTFRAGEDVRAHPYVLVGTGLVNIELDRDDTDDVPAEDDDAMYAEVGAGIRVMLYKGLNLRIEADLLHFRTLNVTHSDVFLNVGLSWLIGGKK